jgi:demethylspheroidene O-methyltransferase
MGAVGATGPTAATPGLFDMLRDRLLGLRDRWLASPRFQRLATRFPLTRPIARSRARALFDLCAGFIYSQVLLACVELRLFEILAEGPRTAEQLAARVDLPQEAMLRLLDAAVSLRLVSRRGSGRYGLGDLGAALLGNPAVPAMVAHHRLVYADLADPVALLRGAAGSRGLNHFWSYASGERPDTLEADAVAPYTTLMAASQPLVAAEVLDAYRLDRHRCLLDVGGGNGAFLTAVAARAPDLRLMLFDLPGVVEHARANLAAVGLAERTTLVGGDFHTDPVPGGADVVSLVRIVHDHDDAAALALLRAVHAALPPGGTLLLAEPMAGTRGAEPIGDAYFGFYLLAMGQGRARSAARLQEMLALAGFRSSRPVPTQTPLLTGLIVAEA